MLDQDLLNRNIELGARLNRAYLTCERLVGLLVASEKKLAAAEQREAGPRGDMRMAFFSQFGKEWVEDVVAERDRLLNLLKKIRSELAATHPLYGAIVFAIKRDGNG